MSKKNTDTVAPAATVAADQLAAETTTPKRRGRPTAFPDRTMVAFLTNIPVEAREALRTLAQRRDVGLNVVVDDLAMRALAASDKLVTAAAKRAATKAAKAAK